MQAVSSYGGGLEQRGARSVIAASGPKLHSGRRATIAAQIYRHLRTQIVTGAFVPLQSLSESELAESFGVSRTPIREALSKLEEESLVSILPQYGTFVAPIRSEDVFSGQFVRQSLECAAIAEAAERCDEQAARLLRENLRLQHASRSGAFFEADDALHRTLMAMAGREAAWHVVDAAKVTLDRVRHLSIRTFRKRQETIQEHKDIIDRVIAQDGEGAAKAMAIHLRGAFASTRRIMDAHPEFFRETHEVFRPTRTRRADRSAPSTAVS
jgi:GntR family transcriptional regulator, rspAB operon transcriptional repressor